MMNSLLSKLSLVYLSTQIVLLIFGFQFCLTNIFKHQNQQLNKSTLYMEELNVEILLYSFVYMEILWRLVFFQKLENSPLFKFSLSFDIVFVVLLFLSILFIHKNPFNFENLILETAAIFFRAVILCIRLSSLVLRLYQTSLLQQNCKDITIVEEDEVSLIGKPSLDFN